MRLLRFFPLLFILISVQCGSLKTTDPDLITLKIYHTNDVHGRLLPNNRGEGGLAYLMSVLKLVRKQDPQALIIDAGDMYKKGSLPVLNSQDLVMADLMSAVNVYDARIVGNNEIKVGVKKLLQWSKTKERAPLLSANLVDDHSKLVFEPYQVFKKKELSIGVIGWTVPFKIENDHSYKLQDQISILEKLVKKLRPQVDVLILGSHQSFEKNKQWAQRFPEIDLVISGHSHILSKDQKTSGENLVVEAGEYGKYLGVVELVYDQKEKKVKKIESTAWAIGPEKQSPDKEIQRVIKQAYQRWAPDADQKITEIDDDLSLINQDSPFEGALPNFMADLFIKNTGADLALVNRQMMRETIYRGNVTKENVFLALPYEDHVAVVQIEKRRLKSMLERSLKKSFLNEKFINFALSKAVLELKFADQLKDLEVKILTPKEKLSLALPEYMVRNCKEFFEKTECPFAKSKRASVLEIRELFISELKNNGNILIPSLDRVRILNQ